MRSSAVTLSLVVALSGLSFDAVAQQPLPPPQQQFPPPQGQFQGQGQFPPPQQQFPQQQFPPPQQQQQFPPPQGQFQGQGQFPPPQQQFPQQQFPQQQFPPQGQFPPPQGQFQGQAQFPPPQGQFQQPPFGQPPPPPPPPPTPDPGNQPRGGGEMFFLYGTSMAYGVGTGIWIDALAKLTDPGPAVIAPIVLGVAAPVGVYFWDQNTTIHRGVAASTATGLALGAVEGMAIAGTQWEFTDNGGPNTWSFRGETSITWVMATAGGVGGWAFGEWLRPDPRSLGFIAGGSAWGTGMGILLGAAVPSDGSDSGKGAAIAGTIGYNLGILATGALSTFYVPSWNTQKWMWLGYAGGAAAGCVIWPVYLFSDAPFRHALIANAVGAAGGLALASIFAGSLTDDTPSGPGAAKNFDPPFMLGYGPAPALTGVPRGVNSSSSGGGMLTAYGSF